MQTQRPSSHTTRVQTTPAHPGNDDLPRVKRRRTSRMAAEATIAEDNSTDDSLSGESQTSKPDATDALDVADEVTYIDLTMVTEVPEELREPDVDHRVKLSAVQCMICMDDAANLTVTHCGHLFCAQCLENWLDQSALGQCPICRSPIQKKEYWLLELKVTRSKRKADVACLEN